MVQGIVKPWIHSQKRNSFLTIIEIQPNPHPDHRHCQNKLFTRSFAAHSNSKEMRIFADFLASFLKIIYISLSVASWKCHATVAILLILNGIFAFVAVFIACELGQRMSDAFVEIDITIDRFDWHLFPIEVQRLLPMVMANAQQSVSLECFGSISCGRVVFKSVCISVEYIFDYRFECWHVIRFRFHFRLSIDHIHILWCSVNLVMENSFGFLEGFCRGTE